MTDHLLHRHPWIQVKDVSFIMDSGYVCHLARIPLKGHVLLRASFCPSISEVGFDLLHIKWNSLWVWTVSLIINKPFVGDHFEVYNICFSSYFHALIVASIAEFLVPSLLLFNDCIFPLYNFHLCLYSSYFPLLRFLICSLIIITFSFNIFINVVLKSWTARSNLDLISVNFSSLSSSANRNWTGMQIT